MMFLHKIKKALWGDLSSEDMKQFGMLALTFAFIIGTYWLMRPLKDGLFFKIVGRGYQPYAKIISFFFIIPVIFLYAKLVDLVEKQKLFYILAGIYSLLFVVITFFIGHETIGLVNKVPAWNRWFGWIIYLGVESYGSLLPALFWSFVASSTDSATAKRGFGLIIGGAQIGAIAGPAFATQAEWVGMGFLTMTVAVCLAMVPLLVKWYITVYPAAAETRVVGEKKAKTGIFEGLRLLLSRPYLVGVFGVAVLYEVVVTIMDYQMKFLADTVYQGSDSFTSFLGYFGVATNSVALVFAIVGTGFFITRFGLLFCLVAYPVVMALITTGIIALPAGIMAANGVWIFFFATMAGKALSYALNNPCKEILFIPTSKDVKFKAKSWIDSFGGRFAKGPAASGVNSVCAALTNPILIGSLFSLGIIGIWLVAAVFVGRRNKELTDSHQQIS